ncbi:adenylosuccinate synthetase [Spiroplasma alleghenense]|uniref:Adenylosuccinate synthetase n=2 Tax=Spiroplasma alleghenense TaxID=216931 RepID=A0A345Z2R7_9MOLU|nr:adenylosuccinate synthase [Spiroplasma alleghenense]AXK50896.1 adenylosuccinate synthetase [Spiroplasma alleghenense]
MEQYKSLVIVGSQWGDEGKGKITDYFAQKASMVVRFSGGDNAGHIIVSEGVKHKVTIVPSGILNPKVVNVIANGAVVNLPRLVSELEILKKAGIDTKNLFLSNRAHVVLPYHIAIDELQEESRGVNKIGTTKRGIGPTYQDKVDRLGIRVCDLFDKNFKTKLKEIVEFKNKLITKVYDGKPLDFETIYKELMDNFEIIKGQVVETSTLIETAIKSKQYVLFEGAQGALLDIDHGTYPFVTSSNTSANNASLGSGINHNLITTSLGVVKAYCTRVGTGGFPTELNNKIGEGIRERGHEYGSNTGRPRRVGWLDIVALKYAIRTTGLDKIFITLLDVLSGEPVVKICTNYLLNGEKIFTIPPLNGDYQKCEPEFIEMQGWKEDITKVKNFSDLPTNAQNYLNKIKELCGINIVGFSVGPDRLQTILMESEF